MTAFAARGVAIRARYAASVFHRGAHGELVGVGVLAQTRFDARRDQCGEIVEIAVEVMAAVGFETAHQRAVQMLRQADRIRHRHDHHFAAQFSGRFEFRQMPPQTPHDEHARQLVRMQRRLNVDLMAVARPVMKTGDAARSAERRRNQFVCSRLHDVRAHANARSCLSGLRIGLESAPMFPFAARPQTFDLSGKTATGSAPLSAEPVVTIA